MSSFADFDPDKFVRSAPEPVSSPVGRFPAQWRHGLAVLAERGAPVGAGAARWAQIIADAECFATRWGDEAIALGWTAGNVFGFDLDLDQDDYFVGAVFHIRSDYIVNVTADRITVKGTDRYRNILRLMPDDARPIWDFRGVVK